MPPSPIKKKIKAISRKSFLVGAATGLVVGTTATAAGAAVAIDANTRSNKEPYQPVAGSLADKVVVITGGTAGLGLVSFRSRYFLWNFEFQCILCYPDSFFLLTMTLTGVRKAIGNCWSHYCVDFPNGCQG